MKTERRWICMYKRVREFKGLPYPGAKWRNIDQIKAKIPRDIEVFVEPFVGGGSVMLSVLADKEYFSKLKKVYVGDLFSSTYYFWKALSTDADALCTRLERFYEERCVAQAHFRKVHGVKLKKHLMDNDPVYKEAYDAVVNEGRELFNELKEMQIDEDNVIEQGMRSYLVHRLSFSGCGFSGGFSAPSYICFNSRKICELLTAGELIKEVEVYNLDYRDLVKYTMNNYADNLKHFIFLDPPYFTQSKGTGLYGEQGDLHKQFNHVDFALWLKGTTDDIENMQWLITYDDSPNIIELFNNTFEKLYIERYTAHGGYRIKGGYRMIKTIPKRPSKGSELFISNYEITT